LVGPSLAARWNDDDVSLGLNLAPGRSRDSWSGDDEFVFARTREADRGTLSDSGEAEGALGRRAAGLEVRDSLSAPVLATLVSSASETGATTPFPLGSYTSGRGEAGRKSGFNIAIDFEGSWTAELQQRFVVAAEYLSTIIRGDLRNRGDIDDIEITARLSDIDGAGSVLGQAGPTTIRRVSGLPFRGEMEFDRADAASYDRRGLFDDIVVHEMLHALGFGTVWDRMGLTDGATYLDGLIFSGRNARVAFKALFPDIFDDQALFRRGVPLETDGGPGTAGGHWDDDTFHRELMTGYLDRRAYVSGLTVAALEDMGYRTVFDADHPLRPIPQPDDLL
jgi:hypothetical protein